MNFRDQSPSASEASSSDEDEVPASRMAAIATVTQQTARFIPSFSFGGPRPLPTPLPSADPPSSPFLFGHNTQSFKSASKSFTLAPGRTIEADNGKTKQFSSLLSLMDTDHHEGGQSAENHRRQLVEAYANTPIFSAAVSNLVETDLPAFGPFSNPIPQFGLVGMQMGIPDKAIINQKTKEDRLVLANMNMPWSAFICGSQGAGKSHTLSCLLENALVADARIGALPNPLSGLVMHYDNYTNSTTTQLCEAAYLCSSGIPVKILVSPSNIWAMKRLYANLPGLPQDSPRPKVLPLYLSHDQLNIARILKLMAVDLTGSSVPLYMEVVMTILREMAMEGTKFSYTEFRRRLDSTKWVSGQSTPLNLRLQLLESFLAPSAMTRSTRPAPAEENIWAFEPGSLTIVDLSDPFVSSEDACSLFAICLSIFLEERSKCGRLVALDEAHKFLLQSGEAQVLTADLTSIIRQQRHTGTRVMIATQEPTLSPDLIDLANVTIVHRFLSPAWYQVLKQHLAGANKQDPGKTNTLFEQIVALKTGEALLFCPTAQLQVKDGLVEPLGNSYTRIRIRNRFTADGGQSIMATGLTDSSKVPVVSTEVLMHVVNKQSSVAQPKAKIPNESATTVGPQPSGQSTATHTSAAVTSDTQLHCRIRDEARKRIRDNIMTWSSKKNINFDILYDYTERGLGLPSGTIKTEPRYQEWVRQAAVSQVAQCRQQRGWKKEK